MPEKVNKVSIYKATELSMAPILMPVDVLQVHGIASENIKVGDILVFKNPLEQTINIMHRVMEITENGKFITKGDDNDNPDPIPVDDTHILGKIEEAGTPARINRYILHNEHDKASREMAEKILQQNALEKANLELAVKDARELLDNSEAYRALKISKAQVDFEQAIIDCEESAIQEQQYIPSTGKETEEYTAWKNALPEDFKEFPIWWNNEGKDGWTFGRWDDPESGITWEANCNDTPSQIYFSRLINCYRISVLLANKYIGNIMVIFNQETDFSHAVFIKKENNLYYYISLSSAGCQLYETGISEKSEVLEKIKDDLSFDDISTVGALANLNAKHHALIESDEYKAYIGSDEFVEVNRVLLNLQTWEPTKIITDSHCTRRTFPDVEAFPTSVLDIPALLGENLELIPAEKKYFNKISSIQEIHSFEADHVNSIIKTVGAKGKLKEVN